MKRSNEDSEASSDEEENVWHIERDHGIANRQQNK
jgi:hypothetical protein